MQQHDTKANKKFQTSLRFDAELKKRMDKVVFDKKQAGEAATFEAEVNEAVRRFLDQSAGTLERGTPVKLADSNARSEANRFTLDCHDQEELATLRGLLEKLRTDPIIRIALGVIAGTSTGVDGLLEPVAKPRKAVRGSAAKKQGRG